MKLAQPTHIEDSVVNIIVRRNTRRQMSNKMSNKHTRESIPHLLFQQQSNEEKSKRDRRQGLHELCARYIRELKLLFTQRTISPFRGREGEIRLQNHLEAGLFYIRIREIPKNIHKRLTEVSATKIIVDE
jgi:hypothetical protein